MKVGVVILNFNSFELTRKLALKLSSYTNIDYIAVIDNVSTDDSYNKLKNLSSEKIIVAKTEKNGGYSYGNNYGAELLYNKNIDILFFSNPDVDISEGDIDVLICNFNEYSEYGILSGIEYDINKKMADPPIWRMNNYIDDVLSCFFFGRKLLAMKKLNLDFSQRIQNVSIIRGSFFGIRYKDFCLVEGFDSNVFLYCEERIICKKIKESGKKIGLVTDAKYFHNHSASIKKTYKKTEQQMRLLYKSILYFNKKYCKISDFKAGVLKVCMKISILEFKLLDILNRR